MRARHRAAFGDARLETGAKRGSSRLATCLAAVALALAVSSCSADQSRGQVLREHAAPSAEDRALLDVLAGAEDQGLAVENLTELQAQINSQDPATAAQGRENVLAAALAYAKALHGQRIDPASVNRQWALAPQPVDVAALFEAARAAGDLPHWLAAQAPSLAGYRELLAQRRAYAAIAREGGWSEIAGSVLREGDRGARVADLRQRLSAEGYAPGEPEEPELFDAALAGALAQFQERHGLTGDGVLGAATRAALNVSAAERVRQIDLNLERWRWLPSALPPTRIEVNVAVAELTLFEADRPVLRMRTIVGLPGNRTPMFAARVEGVIFNPEWNVPDSIARNEIMPLARRDKNYLSAHGYTLTDRRLVQAPGPKNALGQIKFDMPNRFDTYMHDTPARGLFLRDRRTFSHGCVRLASPLDLAEHLLAPDMSREQIEAAIATGITERVGLAAPTPVYMVYFTVFVGEDGALRFADDPYKWDEQLAAALQGADSAAAEPVALAETMCAGLDGMR